MLKAIGLFLAAVMTMAIRGVIAHRPARVSAGRAFYQNGKWYGRDPVVVGMDRFDPRWA